MIEFLSGPAHLPLQLGSRLLCAPGVWAPGSTLPLDELGALVTAPLAWEWDGSAIPWQARAGAFLWAPPRRPLDRYVERLRRERSELPRLFTLAPDPPRQIERALRELEEEHAVGYLLWGATPEIVAAARRGAIALPLVAELCCTDAPDAAAALIAAGADALWIGPPRVGYGGTRLWGPAALPFVLAMLDHATAAPLNVPIVAGAGIASAADARRAREAGADILALDPSWWGEPALASAIAQVLQNYTP